MQCRVEERTIRKQEMVVVECFKCGEEGHKCRQCLLWERVAHPAERKVHQQGERKPAHLERGKVQEYSKKREVRRVEEEEAAHVAKPQEEQQKWRRSSVEELKKRAEEHCGKDVLGEVQLLELGWMTEEIVVTYLTCKCREKGAHVEDNRGQGVVPFWK